eukprot:gene17770-9443_t
MNTVSNIKIRPFSRLTQQEKIEIKRLGPDRPELLRSQSSASSRKFSTSWYTRYEWLTGCSQTQKVYCFPCLLFGESQREKAWTKKGVNDWKHFSEKVKKHVMCGRHVDNCLKLAFFGRNNIAEQLSEAYRGTKQRHNMEVEKNRHVLSKLIDCIKFCGAFELALRGHDETSDSDNPGVFLGLVDFAAALDSVLSKHLETATVFKGTSKTVQNELLDIMLNICKDVIKQEIKEADFLAVVSDDTTDVSNKSQNVVVFRYIKDKTVVERFWSFSTLPQGDANTISSRIIASLEEVLPNPEDKQKLIAQCYDGAADIIANWNGDQHTIREASGLLHWLQDNNFLLFLEFFQRVFPHVEILFAQLQKRQIDPTFIKNCITSFVDAINKERSRIHIIIDTVMTTSPSAKRPRVGNSSADKSCILGEVCDIIISFCCTRFHFTGHLIAANLLDSGSFAKFEKNFPCQILTQTVESYPILDEGKLKSELGVIYSRMEFRECCGALALLQLIEESNLAGTFSEVDKVPLKNKELDADDPKLSRNRKMPARLDPGDPSNRYFPSSPRESYRHIYFNDFDASIENIRAPLQESHLRKNLAMYQVLDGPTARTLGFDTDSFNIYDLIKMFEQLEAPRKSALNEVIILGKILLVMPATNSISERSFYTLKRIKPNLRSTTTNSRLNHLMILHAHKIKLDQLDLIKVANKFVGRIDSRNQVFGKFTMHDTIKKAEVQHKDTQTN